MITEKQYKKAVEIIEEQMKIVRAYSNYVAERSYRILNYKDEIERAEIQKTLPVHGQKIRITKAYGMSQYLTEGSIHRVRRSHLHRGSTDEVTVVLDGKTGASHFTNRLYEFEII